MNSAHPGENFVNYSCHSLQDHTVPDSFNNHCYNKNKQIWLLFYFFTIFFYFKASFFGVFRKCKLVSELIYNFPFSIYSKYTMDSPWLVQGKCVKEVAETSGVSVVRKLIFYTIILQWLVFKATNCCVYSPKRIWRNFCFSPRGLD